MRRPRLLFVFSADFGEFVTARLFCRNQPFDVHYAMPQELARYAPAGEVRLIAYRRLAQIEERLADIAPDVVVLASGYLFAVNGIATPGELEGFVARLRRSGAAIATTDPWLRIWRLRPGSRFNIYSLRRGGGLDAGLSAKMMGLQGALEALLGGLPHLFAVPLPYRADEWLPFFNPDVAESVPQDDAAPREGRDEWLFVLSREDYFFLTGLEQQRFFSALEQRLAELLRNARNRVRFVGPPDLETFFSERWRGEPRVAFTPFCDFDAFEAALRRARVVAYWNVLSSSLLYCLYYRVPPIFFGKGHQSKVCAGLFEHVVEHVYRGRPPQLLELEAPLGADAQALIERLDLQRWLEFVARDFSRSPTPADVVAQLRPRRGGE